jgi:Flp pilus assembly protein TadG
MIKRRKFRRIRVLAQSARGAAAVEMALTLPVLAMLFCGMVSYGGWFFAAHNIQQAANDGARASLAGISPTERATIARSAVETSLRRAGTIDPRNVSVLVDDDGQTLVVRLAYDGSHDAMLSMPLVPVPDTTIRRSAAARLGEQ